MGDVFVKVLNFIMENWHTITVAVLGLVSLIWGVGASSNLNKWIEEARRVYRKTLGLLDTIRKAFDDKHITKEEMENIKEEIEELIKEIKDLF